MPERFEKGEIAMNNPELSGDDVAVQFAVIQIKRQMRG